MSGSATGGFSLPANRLDDGSAAAVEPAPRLSGQAPVLTVSQLNREAARLLQGGLGRLWVGGELSNVTRAASGHWYFTLKDARAAVRAVMFRQAAARVDFRPAEGLQVEVLASAGVYEPRGDFQLSVERMREAGTGDLFRQFIRLKQKLEAEGLFADERKRALPARVRRVGLITSPRGAALRDVLTTLRARAPRLEVILYPASVQGDRAPAELIAALDAAEARREVDVLLLVRGGGSIEDLRAFNDEGLARRVAASDLPIVCGVGHETDFSICDFVSDWRAATPTAAAVAVSRDGAADRVVVARLAVRLGQAMAGDRQDRDQAIDLLSRRLRPPRRQIADQHLALDQAARRIGAAHAQALRARQDALRVQVARLRPPQVEGARTALAVLTTRLTRAGRQHASERSTRLTHLAAALGLVNPRSILGRGYALAFGADGRVLRDPAQVGDDELLRIELAQGSINARATVDKGGAMREDE